MDGDTLSLLHKAAAAAAATKVPLMLWSLMNGAMILCQLPCTRRASISQRRLFAL